jgi:orotate phosphoribosyltransferase
MENKVIKMLEDCGALITGSHLVYTSGRHGSAYLNKDALCMHPEKTCELCKIIADKFADCDVDAVAGPTMGGVVLSQWVAYHLNRTAKAGVLSVYAEEDESKHRIFKRGFGNVIAGKNVLVVEDILTTGGSARKVVDAVRQAGGNVAGLAVLCNRGGVEADAVGGVEIFSLASVNFDSWPEDSCPLCSSSVPINTEVGKGREFLNKKLAVAGS